MTDYKKMTDEQLQQHIEDTMHAVQSAVALKMNIDPSDTSPKHLRVGVNSSLVSNSALVRTLVDKGLFTLREYCENLALVWDEEKQSYKAYIDPTGRIDFR